VNPVGDALPGRRGRSRIVPPYIWGEQKDSDGAAPPSSGLGAGKACEQPAGQEGRSAYFLFSNRHNFFLTSYRLEGRIVCVQGERQPSCSGPESVSHPQLLPPLLTQRF
jgi:hypothetical protein